MNNLNNENANTIPQNNDTENSEKKIEALLKEAMDSSYKRGLLAGVYTASKVVSDILNDKSKPLMARIERVKNYCKVSVNNKEKFVPTPDSGNISNNENEQLTGDDTIE